MRKTILNIFVVLFFFALLPIYAEAQEQQYYADLTVEVQLDGSVKISGLTNDPSLMPGTYGEFTNKKGIYWLLNISSEKNFSDYILSVKLPAGSEFNYLKTGGRSRVRYDDGINIIASGSGSLNLLVQYNIDNSKNSGYYIWIATALIILLILIIGYFLWRGFLNKNKEKKAQKENKKNKISKNKKETSEKNSKKESGKERNKDKNIEEESKVYEKIIIIKKTLAESQEKIIDLLLEADGQLIQKQLQHRSGLPKATLSRNVDILSKKGIILKQSRGMTNMIMLNKEWK